MYQKTVGGRWQTGQELQFPVPFFQLTTDNRPLTTWFRMTCPYFFKHPAKSKEGNQKVFPVLDQRVLVKKFQTMDASNFSRDANSSLVQSRLGASYDQ